MCFYWYASGFLRGDEVWCSIPECVGSGSRRMFFFAVSLVVRGVVGAGGAVAWWPIPERLGCCGRFGFGDAIELLSILARKGCCIILNRLSSYFLYLFYILFFLLSLFGMVSQLALFLHMQKGFRVHRIPRSSSSPSSTVLSPEIEATDSFSMESSSTSLDDRPDEYGLFKNRW